MASLPNLKHLLIGRPIATKHAHHERLTNVAGLAVFASDALSSVAYATEESLRILVLAATPMAFAQIMPISFVLVGLLVIVGLSYYQTIHEYPDGGGSYSVTKDNLHPIFSRIAAAALLIDYVLTVSVSVAAGVAALVSAVPGTGLNHFVVEISVGCVLVVAWLNLRGVKESGSVFSFWTYGFILSMMVLVVVGVAKTFGQPTVDPTPHLAQFQAHSSLYPLTILLWLRAFAASCTAMTGVEAISNGVQAFRKPESDNASKTLIWMCAILGTMFLGVSWMANHFAVVPMNEEDPHFMTVTAQIAAQVFGKSTPVFYIIQFFTSFILVLAANTAFADFPRLASLVARDSLLPRGLTNLGDRLVFNRGIVLLTVLSSALIIGFQAKVNGLIPLYAVGVFTAFTLSQSGMVVHWIKKGKRGFGMLMNLTGATVTGLVTLILTVTKWSEGAWITVFAVGFLMVVFWAVNNHYSYLAKELELEATDTVRPLKTVVLMLVPGVHKGILRSIAYAQSLSHDVRGIHVTLSPQGVDKVKNAWTKFGADIPLVILESPYRSLVKPVLDYVDDMTAADPDLMVTVIVPQAVPKYPWHTILHNNAAVLFKRALGGRKNVVITNVRYFLS